MALRSGSRRAVHLRRHDAGGAHQRFAIGPRVARPAARGHHAGETGLADNECDAVIDNDHDIEALFARLGETVGRTVVDVASAG